MRKKLVVILTLFFITCSGTDEVLFEKLNFHDLITKAQQQNKNIMVDVFSDG
jgi:hypothetical protein